MFRLKIRKYYRNITKVVRNEIQRKHSEQNFLLTNLAVCLSYNVDFTTTQQKEEKAYDKHYSFPPDLIWTQAD